MLELPAGPAGRRGGGAREAAAERELVEEAGLEASDWAPLGSAYSSPGITTELIHYFLARGLRDVDRGDFVPAHEEADMETLWVPYAELLAACLDGRVHDAPVLVAVLTAGQRGLARRVTCGNFRKRIAVFGTALMLCDGTSPKPGWPPDVPNPSRGTAPARLGTCSGGASASLMCLAWRRDAALAAAPDAGAAPPAPRGPSTPTATRSWATAPTTRPTPLRWSRPTESSRSTPVMTRPPPTPSFVMNDYTVHATDDVASGDWDAVPEQPGPGQGRSTWATGSTAPTPGRSRCVVRTGATTGTSRSR